MDTRARTPEELETLFEDSLLVRDRAGLAALFEEMSVLVSGEQRPVRGGAEIALKALATWNGAVPYVADPQRVVQARDLALVVADRTINVARRGCDGAWRYAILFASVDHATERRRQ